MLLRQNEHASTAGSRRERDSKPLLQRAAAAVARSQRLVSDRSRLPVHVAECFALVLNYKHNRFSITPALTLNQGAEYGNPSDFQGLDPRVCTANQSSAPALPTSPHAADYTRRATFRGDPERYALHSESGKRDISTGLVSSRSRGSSTWACR